MITLTAGALATVVEPFVGRALTGVQPQGDGGWLVSSRIPAVPLLGPDQNGSSWLGALVLVITVVVLVLRLRPPVRRRVLLLAAPAAATTLLVQTDFEDSWTPCRASGRRCTSRPAGGAHSSWCRY
jgi:hypothetical protein